MKTSMEMFCKSKYLSWVKAPAQPEQSGYVAETFHFSLRQTSEMVKKKALGEFNYHFEVEQNVIDHRICINIH